MTSPAKARISSRKQPRQARSTELVAAILEAAVQVLAKEGATRFTTARVAEKAGVSVGSLYQYFPNKAAILFRLQSDEWRETGDMVRVILEDRSRPPDERLRRLAHAFLRSECEEAAVRTALGDAAPFYREAAEAKVAREAGRETVRCFVEEALPHLSEARSSIAGELVMVTLSAAGREFSQQPRGETEIESYAGEVAAMLCAYFAALRSG